MSRKYENARHKYLFHSPMLHTCAKQGDYYVNSGSEKEAIVNSAQDYYAFGMLMPGRTYTAPNQASYRYGFNGKENDNEVGKGEGDL